MKFNLRKINLLFVMLLFAGITKAQQQSKTYKPNSTVGIDALISEYSPTSNYGTYNEIIAQYWTSGGSPVVHRSLIKLPFSDIDAGSIIDSAYMTLYGVDHSPLTQSNACWLQLVRAVWTESGVTWATMPASTTSGEISLAQSTSSTQNYKLDITSHVQKMSDSSSYNYGWILRLKSEASQYCRMVFASSDYTTDTTKWPKVVVYYHAGYYRSATSGNFESSSTWQTSSDNVHWVSATRAPNYNCKTITIQSGHTVTVTASDSLDEIVVASGGALVFGNYNVTPFIHNGAGADISTASGGKIIDACQNAVVFASSATFSMAGGDSLIKTRATTDQFLPNYSGGNSTIPATAVVDFRKTIALETPTVSTTATYPNVVIENSTGTTWTINYTGSAALPTVKGSWSLGGSQTGVVNLNNTNTNVARPVFQNFHVASGCQYTMSNPSGLEVQGNISLSGTTPFSYGSSSYILYLTGSSNATISATNSQSWKNLTLNKSTNAKTVTLNKDIAISGTLTLTAGQVITTSTNLLTLNNGATISGGSSNSYVIGPLKKIGNSSFKFEIGSATDYKPLTITAPSSTSDSYTAAYFGTGQTYGSSCDSTITYISGCEYWSLSRSGSSNITPTIYFDQYSCISNLYPTPKIVAWNSSTSKWNDFGYNASTLTFSINGGTIQTNTALTTYTAITLGNNSNNSVQPTDTDFVPSAYRYIKNNGQLVNTSGSAIPGIKYYMPATYPMVYLADTSVSYIFSHVDTTASTNDTLIRVDVKYTGANSTVAVAQNQDSTHNNFYLGYCPTGIINVPQFQRLSYTNLYNNIDLVYTQNSSGIKYTFNCKLGAKPDAIKAKYTGADSVKVKSGKLYIYTKLEDLVFSAPLAFQIDSSNALHNVTCNWSVTSNTAAFVLPSGFDAHLPLIIRVEETERQQGSRAVDNLRWSTYIGGNGADFINKVTVDANGDVYAIGTTMSSNFPITTGFSANVYHGSEDVFIAAFNSNYVPKWIVYAGSDEADEGLSISCDNQQHVYFTATSINNSGTKFPIINRAGAYNQGIPSSLNNLGIIGRINKTAGTSDWITSFGDVDYQAHTTTGCISTDHNNRKIIAGSTVNRGAFPIVDTNTVGGVLS